MSEVRRIYSYIQARRNEKKTACQYKHDIYLSDVKVATYVIPRRTIVSGENFRLRCAVEVMGFSITWVRERVVIGKSTTRGRHLTVTIPDANQYDEGEYKCIAQRGNCTVTSSLFLNVEGNVFRLGMIHRDCGTFVFCSSTKNRSVLPV